MLSHPFTVNLNMQLIPIADSETAYPVIDRVIALIQHSGLPYQVGAFGTAVEGSYAALHGLVLQVNELLLTEQVAEWVLNLQWHIKGHENVSMEGKTAGR